jgi:hypothetical protein
VSVDSVPAQFLSSARRWFVIAAASLLLLSACQSTASVELTNGAISGAEATQDEGDVREEPPAITTNDDEANEDPGTESPEVDAPQPNGARFKLRGELPLSIEEVNAVISFIEEETGRGFVRPPVIVAQSSEAFLTGLQDDLSDFQADADVSVRTLQALGLTDRGVDEVAQAFEDLLLSPEGILGYYDSATDELYLPVGASSDDELSSLLVHELTHALDGQHVDLNVFDDLVAAGEISGDFEPVATLQAVVEGRASSVQSRWLAANEIVLEVSEDLGSIADVPPALVLGLSLPYAFGEIFIEANGGAADTWDSLADPPASSEGFMVPNIAADETIVAVATPAADGPVLHEGVYGATDIFTWLLGESLEPDPSLIFLTFAAIDGWAGGRAVLWGDDTESCIRIAIAADSALDLTEIEDVVAAWADGNSARSVEATDDIVTATGCAPYLP